MKLIAIAAVLSTFCAVFAAEPPQNPGDPLGGAFFPPEAILGAGEQIGLKQEQQEAIRGRMEKAQAGANDLRQRLERETAALAAVVNQPHIDEAALKTQLDKVLDAERELKQHHLGLLAGLKNILTPEQQAKLREMGKAGGQPGVEAARRRLREKMEQVRAAMEKWAASGRDPSEVGKMMAEKVQPLVGAGKVDEAIAVLDKVLEQLKADGQ